MDVQRHPRRLPPADVYAWDTRTGRLLRRLHGLYIRSNMPVVSPDGSHIFSYGTTLAHPNARTWASQSPTRDTVINWDWQTGEQVWATEGEMPLAISPDGRKIAFARPPTRRSVQNVGMICDAATGKPLCRTSTNVEVDGQIGFTPDGKWLGAIDQFQLDPKTGFTKQSIDVNVVYAGNFLRLWRTDTGQHVRDYPFIRARAFDFSRDGQWLVIICDRGQTIGGSDGSIVRRVDFATGKVLWTRERSMNDPDHDPNAILNSVAISPNGKYVVVQSSSSQLTVLDARTGRELFRPFAPQGREDAHWVIPGGLAFSADGRTLVSRCGRNVMVWDASSLR